MVGHLIGLTGLEGGDNKESDTRPCSRNVGGSLYRPPVHTLPHRSLSAEPRNGHAARKPDYIRNIRTPSLVLYAST